MRPGQPRRTPLRGTDCRVSARGDRPARVTVALAEPALPLLGLMLPLSSRRVIGRGKRSIEAMARASLPSEPVTELYLIQGEVPDTRDLDDARQWVTIYRELVTFADRTLARLRRDTGINGETEVSTAGDADERWMEG